MFRVTAGLPSDAKPLGGWEAPGNELRGHFTGHFLSACAMMAARGDETLRRKGSAIVAGMAQCQARHGDGYVSAFPRELFDRLNRRERVWAPFYTLHKILAGLIDMHTLGGDAQALSVARGLGDWTDRWTAAIAPDHMQLVLDTEFGGMGEALWNLQAVTGDKRYGAAAERFEKRKFLDPLAARTDALTGLHANTHIPQVIAAARKAELTGDARSREIADFFLTDVTNFRCFATGGTSSGEEWKAPRGHLYAELDAYTHECCCTHNMLKLTRMSLSSTPSAAAGDYYERALFNGVLGTHNPADGMMMYYVPMASGFWKMFSNHDDGFWCCDGTGVESFAKLNDSVYFHDQTSLWVNLYAASEVEWRERGVKLVQTTDFPSSGRVTLTVRCGQPLSFALVLRIPAWAKGASVTWAAGPMAPPVTPGTWLHVDREWRDGDRIELDLPMRLRFEPMADDPSLASVMYGPLVLAGRLGADKLPPTFPYAEPTKPREVPEFKADPVAAPSFERVELSTYEGDHPEMVSRAFAHGFISRERAQGLVFGAHWVGESHREVSLTPFYQLQGERYAIYWYVGSHAPA
jgi:DUF1680 family protein